MDTGPDAAEELTTARGIGSLLGALPRGPVPPVLPKVLVVEDDAATARLIARILEGSGYQPCIASNGKAATAAILADPPDFLLTDWQMPDMDGIELCRWVRQQALPKYVYAIMVTVFTETKHMVQAIAAGADDFFSKPVRPGELLSRMQAGLRIIELERQLRMRADYDPLTGLLNRRAFLEIVQKEWARSARADHPLACVMIDIDHFKQVNDLFGHFAGDEVLKAVAAALRDGCRQSDPLCRYGGEEFCVLLLDADEHDGMTWSQRCGVRIAGASVLAELQPIAVTASFGVSARRQACPGYAALLNAADQALLAAKRSGRNRAVAFSALEQASLPA